MRADRGEGDAVTFSLGVILLCIAGVALAFSVPPYQQTSPGGDEVRARDGTTCRMGQHPTPVLDIGGTAGNDPSNSATMQGYGAMQSENAQMGGGVYGRVVIPLDVTGIPRVDCSRLYDLEVERLQIEIEQLKKGAEGGVQVE